MAMRKHQCLEVVKERELKRADRHDSYAVGIVALPVRSNALVAVDSGDSFSNAAVNLRYN